MHVQTHITLAVNPDERQCPMCPHNRGKHNSKGCTACTCKRTCMEI